MGIEVTGRLGRGLTVALLAAGYGAFGAGAAGASALPGTTVVATVDRSVPRYAFPGQPRHGAPRGVPAGAPRGVRVQAAHRASRVPATWHGFPSVLPVIRTRPGWVEVRLAQRPDGSTTWLPDRDVTLGRTVYRIVIDLTTTHLTLYRYGRPVFTAPAGVGTVDDPTPAGHFFVAFREAAPSPDDGYGPFILVTSAHSEQIADWAGTGDAVVGIHGPLDASRAIGTTGARVSHGCVRLHLASLRKLREVPPGTPVDIVR